MTGNLRADIEALAASNGAWKGEKHVRVTQRTDYGEVTRSAIWVDDLRAILAAHPVEESVGEVRMSVTREQWATAVDAAEESIAGDDRVTTRFPRSVAFNTLGDAFAALGVTVTGEEADR